MFKPGDVKELDLSSPQKRLDSIESYLDARLREAVFYYGVAKISMNTRTNYSYEEFETVLNKYRKEGWVITGTGPWYFTK